MGLTEAKDIKKRWQENTEDLYQKNLHDPDNHDGVITHLEPDILYYEVKWEASLRTKLVEVMEFQFSSLQFCHSVVSDSLWPHESQHARPPCPSPTSGVYSKSCPPSQCCHPAISSSVIPFSSCLRSLPSSGSFPMSQLFTWGGQKIGVSASASVLPMNTQDWSPLGWTGWISLQPKGL